MNRTPVPAVLVCALVLGVGLSACSKKDADVSAARSPASSSAGQSPASESPAAARSASAASSDNATPADIAAAPQAEPAQAAAHRPSPSKAGAEKPALVVTAPELAYAYQYGVEAPPAAVPMLVRLHESVCAAAGATTCQVVGADTRQVGRDDVTGRLEIRAEPHWLREFRGRIEEDVKTAHGKLQGSQIETEDLSRSIVDAEAGLEAKKTLRDRMRNLLATHNGKLNDLVELERQVSEVQGQIDAAQSELAVMKTRVATARLTIDYRSSLAMAPDSAFGRLSHATHGVLRHSMDTLSVLVTLLGYLLPFGLIAGVVAWVFRGRVRRSVRPTSEPGA